MARTVGFDPINKCSNHFASWSVILVEEECIWDTPAPVRFWDRPRVTF